MALPQISEAIALIEDEKAADAIPILEELSARYPLYIIPFLLRAQAFEAIGEPQRALEAWRQARFLAPDRELILDGIRRTTRQWLELSEEVIDPADMEGDFASAADIYETEEPATGDAAAAFGEDQSEDRLSDTDTIGPDKLDELIDRLEGSKLTPADDPDAYPDPLVEEDDSELVSETLARIYRKQSRYLEAARVYRMLASRHPDKKDTYLQLSQEMETMLETPDEPGTDSEN